MSGQPRVVVVTAGKLKHRVAQSSPAEELIQCPKNHICEPFFTSPEDKIRVIAEVGSSANVVGAAVTYVEWLGEEAM